MRFDRESYRKLYVAESAEHQLMALASRGLRDYLLRFAAEDGTLLPSTTDPVGDMMVVLRARPSDKKLVSSALTDLQRVGYLKLERKRLWIVKFEEAQEARSPGATRQKRHREKVKTSGGGEPDGGVSDVTSNGEVGVTARVTDGVTSNAPRNAHVTSPLADETRRNETRAPKPPAGDSRWPPRPVIPASLLEAPTTAKSLEIAPAFREYAKNCGLSGLQFDDVVTDFREKIVKTETPTRLNSLLFRFIEARARKIIEKSPTLGPEIANTSVDSGSYDRAMAEAWGNGAAT